MKVLDLTGLYKGKEGETVIVGNPLFINDGSCVGFDKVIASDMYKDVLKGVENVSFVKQKKNGKA